jgi:hypothetical protein
MPKAGAPATIVAMQRVLVPPPAQPAAPGQLCCVLPGAPAGTRLELHTLEPGAAAVWPAAPHGALLVLSDGFGKAAFDDGPQRVSAPCVLRLPAGSELRLINQGPTAMRLVFAAPVAHGEAAV